MAMTFTAAQLLTRSYQLMGVIASGEVVAADLAQDGLVILNGLLDGFATQRLALPATQREVFSYTANVSTYLIGPGATWDTTRPTGIDYATVLSSTASPSFEIPMGLLDDQSYQAITQKSLTATFPVQLYYNATNAVTGSIFVWPTPTNASSYAQVLYTPTALAQFSTIATSVTMAPGYYRMLYYNLAIELGMANAVPWRPDVADKATASLKDIKRLNLQPLDLVTDAALPGLSGIYNGYSDTNY